MVKVLPQQLQNTRCLRHLFVPRSVSLIAHVQIINHIHQLLAILWDVEIFAFSLQRKLESFKDIGC